MLDKQKTTAFTRTRSTWLILTLSVCAWLTTSVWAFRVATNGNQSFAETLSADVANGYVDHPAKELDKQYSAKKLAPDLNVFEEAERLTEQQAAEEAQRLAEQQAAEEAQCLAEQQAAEEVQRLAEQQAAEEAQRLAEQRVAEEAQSLVEQNDTVRTVDKVGLNEKSQQLEIGEQQRESAIAAEQNRDTGVLNALSGFVRFENRNEVVDREIEQILERMRTPLLRYPDSVAVVTVASNEFKGLADNNRLSLERGRAIMRYLEQSGLQSSNIEVLVAPGGGLDYGAHRVEVSLRGLEK